MKVAEIFTSIDGEANGWLQGRLTTFIRLSGCNLQCSYCDTHFTQDPNFGKEMTVLEILDNEEVRRAHHITITGGEPLLWLDMGLDLLLEVLSEQGKCINVETNGTILPPAVLRTLSVRWTVDLKIPYIDQHQFLPRFLRCTDVLKIVISSVRELELAFKYIKENDCSHFVVALSPNLEKFSAMTIVHEMKQHNLRNVTLNLQLHKFADLK
jgi:7-carboxy-7-deazaguanine synthase